MASSCFALEVCVWCDWVIPAVTEASGFADPRVWDQPQEGASLLGTHKLILEAKHAVGLIRKCGDRKSMQGLKWVFQARQNEAATSIKVTLKSLEKNQDSFMRGLLSVWSQITAPQCYGVGVEQFSHLPSKVKLLRPEEEHRAKLSPYQKNHSGTISS